jgi:hypothetical protein
MPSSGMLRHVALVRTDISEELRASIIRVPRTGELETLAVTSNRCLLRSWSRVCSLVTVSKELSKYCDMFGHY